MYKDMDPGELIKMRETGMTNKEIADSLGVHYETVLKLIGKQPKGLRKGYVRQCNSSDRGGGRACA